MAECNSVLRIDYMYDYDYYSLMFNLHYRDLIDFLVLAGAMIFFIVVDLIGRKK